jgi:hypothetical protein
MGFLGINTIFFEIALLDSNLALTADFLFTAQGLDIGAQLAGSLDYGNIFRHLSPATGGLKNYLRDLVIHAYLSSFQQKYL